ncbi:MAG: Holliday junction branch migration protein RuvA [Corynebacterium sp.]|nr:Holliday junction branch migration protein RuvA [Corynebacterium sp.]
MIASLRGVVIDKRADSIVVECAGVGYEVYVTPQTSANFPRGEEAFVLVEHIIREADERLFGFADHSEREFFRAIQAVSGIGPKIASAALSVLSVQELSHAIAANDAKALQKIPGVGKKVAERLCLELKDKVEAFVEPAETMSSATQPTLTQTLATDQVLEALLSLGFSERHSEQSLAKVMATSPDLDVSGLLAAALKAMND